MKPIVIAALYFLITIVSFGQVKGTMDVLNLKEENVMIYSPKVTSGKLLCLKMEYGSPQISNESDILLLKGASIANIDFVYTDHPVNAKFQNLTKLRIEKLKKLYPDVFNKKGIKWRMIRQQEFLDKEGAKKLFHGVVIVYKPMQSPEGTKKEMVYLKKLFPDPHKIRVESITYVDAVALSEEYKTDSVFKRGKILSKREYIPGHESFTDSTVLAALSRNNWKSMTITADLTGSMSPYTAQLLIWIRSQLNAQRVNQFVFFNDGDRTTDYIKILGKTGGIYTIRSSKFEEVKQMAFTTMKNGNGGDTPENNIEALIKAIELNPEAKEIIMIADSWASIKDMSLASKINKPIRILLCGSDFGIHPDYLNLARMTGGSIHTMKEDITNLRGLIERKEFTIQGQRFKLENDIIINL